MPVENDANLIKSLDLGKKHIKKMAMKRILITVIRST